MSGRGPRTSLLWIGAACVSFLLIYVVAVRLGFGQHVDDLAYEGRKAIRLPVRRAWASVLLVVSAPLAVAATGITAVVAARRGEARFGVASVLAVIAAGVLSRVAKWALPRPELLEFSWAGPANSYPSGHVAVFATAVMLVASAAPRGRRHVVVPAVAGLLTWQATAVLTSGWHRPSDLLGGFAVAALAVGATALLAPPLREVPDPADPQLRAWTVPAVAIVVASLPLAARVPAPGPTHSTSSYWLAGLVVAACSSGLAMCSDRALRPT